MDATRGELEWSLDDLEGRLEKMRRDHVADDDFWGVVHAYADPILEDASPDDIEFVRERLRTMIVNAGLDFTQFSASRW
jgi:hypothetical protein